MNSKTGIALSVVAITAVIAVFAATPFIVAHQAQGFGGFHRGFGFGFHRGFGTKIRQPNILGPNIILVKKSVFYVK